MTFKVDPPHRESKNISNGRRPHNILGIQINQKKLAKTFEFEKPFGLHDVYKSTLAL